MENRTTRPVFVFPFS
jgi:hypothetical protein